MLFTNLDDELWHVTEQEIKCYYTGKILKLFCGMSHDIILTPEGYKSRGENTYFQLGSKHRFTTTFLDAEYINELDVETISVGGWHNYARLRDGRFFGWGLNSVRLLFL